MESEQVRRQAALLRLSADLAAADVEEDIHRGVVDGLRDTLGYDFLVLFLVDEESGNRVMAACVGFKEPPSPVPPGVGISEAPILDGKLHYTPDVTQDPRYFYGLGGSEVDVPVYIGGKVLAVLTAEKKKRDAFDKHDFEVLTAAAQQTGLAIEKARLLAEERKRADELDALRRTMTDITAEHELSSLLQVIVERAIELLGASAGGLGLYDEVNQEVEVAASLNLEEDYIGTRQKLGEGAMGRVAETGQALMIDDYGTWEGSMPQYRHLHATMAVPLEVSGCLLGVFTAATTDPNQRFTDADLHLLNMFAQQAALAIDNARLLAEERKRADELEALRTTLTDITAELELSTLLHVIMERAVELLNASGGELALYDEESQEIEIVVSLNLGEDYVGTRHKLGEGAMGLVAQTREPLFIDDYAAWAGSLPEYPQIRATMAVPLEVGGRLVGVFTTVTTDVSRQFTRDDLHLLNLFAQQTSIAIENARLFDHAQQEIAKRKRIEGELRQQKEYFEALVVNSPVAVVTADLDGNLISWNPMAEKLFKYTQDEVIGRNLDEIVANDDTIREEAEGYTTDVICEGRVEAITKRTRKDGSLVDVELLALPVIVGDEEVGFIVIYVDITELQEARRQAEEANQAKSVFLANMSHELRTPLNAILGFSQLMDQDTNLTSMQQENLEIITQSGEHLLSLINDVLEMSKIEAGEIKLQEKSFDLYLLLDNLEDMLRMQAEDKGLRLLIERDEETPQYVVADEGKLRQVLTNLLGNAVKFTYKGGVTMRVRSSSKGTAQDEEGVRLKFEVEDSGPGIEPESLGAVFEPFIQSIVEGKIHEGTGLGLSISRQFVRLMGGDLSAGSQVGVGSLFKFDIQVGLAEAAELDSARPRQRVVGLEPDQPTYRLLIVEENKTNRRLLVRLLGPLGFELEEAINGQEGIDAWERWDPHLIFMDMRMPVMDGYEAARRIKATPEGKDTVVVALTASAFEEDRESILSGGCDDFMRKPFRQYEIFDMLAKHLGVRFIYEKKEPEPGLVEVPTKPTEEVLTPSALSALPADWMAELKGATIRADQTAMLGIIEEIRAQDPVMADALGDLSYNFEYKKILDLIEGAGGQG
jgi:PAS domain S-box-containing protein